jgi:hypothetical protein
MSLESLFQKMKGETKKKSMKVTNETKKRGGGMKDEDKNEIISR